MPPRRRTKSKRTKQGPKNTKQTVEPHAARAEPEVEVAQEESLIDLRITAFYDVWGDMSVDTFKDVVLLAYMPKKEMVEQVRKSPLYESTHHVLATTKWNAFMAPLIRALQSDNFWGTLPQLTLILVDKWKSTSRETMLSELDNRSELVHKYFLSTYDMLKDEPNNPKGFARAVALLTGLDVILTPMPTLQPALAQGLTEGGGREA